jgi:hypothetical protein
MSPGGGKSRKKTTGAIIKPSSSKKEKSLRSWSACAAFFRPKAMKRNAKKLKGVGTGGTRLIFELT